MQARILLVEDEGGLVMTLTDLLQGEGYEVESARDGFQALEMAARHRYDLIILDVMLPGKSGLEVCRELRNGGDLTPVLMLTARDQLADKVVGLKLGADDYVTKPFEALELLARTEALLRRSRAGEANPGESIFRFGNVVVNFRSTEVQKDGKPVDLSAREFELLRFLIEKRGATISRKQLLAEVWGYEAPVLTRTVDVHMALLRQKLEDDPKNPAFLVTVRGFGYKFVQPEAAG